MNTDTANELELLKEAGQVRTFDLRTVAAALGVSQSTLKNMAKTSLRTVQAKPNAKRYVPLDELERLHREGWPVDVDALLDAD